MRAPQLGAPAIGLAPWVGLVLASRVPARDLTWIDLLLAFGPLVVVPLAWPLLCTTPPVPWTATAAGGVAVAVALSVPRGALASGLASVWLAGACAGAARVLSAWTRVKPRTTDVAALVVLVAHAYLVVGAFFIVATRAGWRPGGIAEPIVELTGVHFTYAGFATLALVRSLLGACPERRAWVIPAVVLAVGGPPIVAAGFEWHVAFFQIAGATVLALATWWISGVTVTLVLPRVRATARALLGVSSLAVLAPMVLAVFWATAQYFDVPALSIAQMARVHGSLNAFGFVTCGLLGWRVATGR